MKLTEWKINRNFIRVGDTIKVKPTPPKRNGYTATVKEIVSEDGVTPKHITVIDQKRQQFRTVGPERVQRVAQSRVEKRK